MKLKTYFILLLLFLVPASYGAYFTPGTGVKWNLNDLVTNSGGAVTFSGGEYFFNDDVYISLNDTLQITTNVTAKFADSKLIDVNGVLLIDPPTSVLFTAQNIANRFNGIRVDSSNSTVIRNLTMEYAQSLRILDCSITVDSCIFRYNNSTTTFANGTISVFRSNSRITNCQFIDNQRAAIQGGSNIANAPQIIGCTFIGNNILNGNVPQINLGTSGTDTVRILNNYILRASTNSGGIGFLPIGNVYAVITGNIIINNRYGITFNGGSNINALISYNQIDSNNTQGNPNLGGSGIAFTGGSPTSHQNSIVTGNLFRWNLWGVTIQNGSRPNLGNLGNADTSDNGKNYFLANNNTTTYRIDLYNNSIDTVYAQNNFWGTENIDTVEARIFHQPDNPALGPVYYTPAILPVELISFTVNITDNTINLIWITSTELNNSGFAIERRTELSSFEQVGFVRGKGTTSETQTYTFSDNNLSEGRYFYRLKQIDFDGSISYSKEINVDLVHMKSFSLEQNYPNPFNPVTIIKYSIPQDGFVKLTVMNILGESVAVLVNENMKAGKYEINFNASNLSSGIYFYKLEANNFTSTKKMLLIR